MIRVRYAFDQPFAGQDEDDRGYLEFPDGTSDAEIDAEVRELFFNRYNYGWSIE